MGDAKRINQEIRRRECQFFRLVITTSLCEQTHLLPHITTEGEAVRLLRDIEGVSSYDPWPDYSHDDYEYKGLGDKSLPSNLLVTLDESIIDLLQSHRFKFCKILFPSPRESEEVLMPEES